MIPPLHVVTDEEVLRSGDFLPRARRILEAGGPELALHLRGPGIPGGPLHRLGRELSEIAREAGGLLLANDRVDVAAVLELDGVQLPGRSLPPGVARKILGAGALVGVSVHDADAAGEAQAGGADFLVVGTVFATSSHPERVGKGPALVTEVADRTDLPLIAIGGVTPGRVSEVVRSGAAGVAVLSGVWGAEHPADAVREYGDALEGSRTISGERR